MYLLFDTEKSQHMNNFYADSQAARYMTITTALVFDGKSLQT